MQKHTYEYIWEVSWESDGCTAIHKSSRRAGLRPLLLAHSQFAPPRNAAAFSAAATVSPPHNLADMSSAAAEAMRDLPPPQYPSPLVSSDHPRTRHVTFSGRAAGPTS